MHTKKIHASVLLVISGSIAAYKSLELIRRLRKRGVEVHAILTKGGAEFITPLSVSSLSGTPTYTDLFSLKDETEMGHIRLSRESDLIVVAPASANIIAKMTAGIADDLATATLLATDKPVLIAPAMNAQMWNHKATQRNLAQLTQDGVTLIAPGKGSLACGETGDGRMAEPEDILAAIGHFLARSNALAGVKALVTSGPTHEAIDPVRFIGNRSSGKQGHAIAAALAARGAEVTLVSGPVALPDPAHVNTVHVTSAAQMHEACLRALPVDVAICAAAVADWRVETPSARKLKKRTAQTPPAMRLAENPDILHALSTHKKRPRLVIGFAAETENAEKHAAEKRARKACDWMLANDVSGDVFGADDNQVTLITAEGREQWPRMRKRDIAERLAERIAAHVATRKRKTG